MTENWLHTKDGSDIYYRVVGQGQPIVFLHGNSLSSRYFDKQIAYFSKYYQVIVMDSRGHGKSHAKLNTISFRQIAVDLKDILVHLEIDKVILVGHSDGANLALVFQTMLPDMVRGLLLNSGNLTIHGQRWWDILLVRIAYKFLHYLGKLFPYMRQKAQVISLMLEDLKISPADLQHVSTPVMVLVGNKDIIKLNHSKKLASYFPRGEFYSLVGFGHHIIKQDSHVFNIIAKKFINDTLKGEIVEKAN